MLLKLFVIGNLGRDAEIKDINGYSVIDFPVAHTEKYTSQGVQKEKTTWMNCSYWTDKTAVAQYLKKGKQVFVEGSPEVYAYMNKDNQNSAGLRVRVQSVRLLGNKNDDTSSDTVTPSNTSSSTSSNSQEESSDDDLPF